MRAPEAESRGQILMVGRRKGAVSAARRLGWTPVAIDLPARGEQAPGAFGGSVSWAVKLADELFPNGPPASVVAVATGAVVAAAAIRAHFGLPGTTREVARRCHDKLVMKKAVAKAGIPCARWAETREDTSANGLIEKLGLPLVLKTPISSGGRGVRVCKSAEEVGEHLRPGLLAEAFVEGTEMSVETFRAGGKTLFRNRTCYLKPRWANVVPAELDPAESRLVDQLAESVHRALGIHQGMSHMELFLSEEGPVFGEIAARPPGGYLMELMSRAYGFDPWESLLQLETGEETAFPDTPLGHAGVWIIHPGAGTVREVHGVEEARALSGVVAVSCKLKAGDVVDERLGSGDSKGKIVAVGSTQAECAEALRRAVETVRLSLVAPVQ